MSKNLGVKLASSFINLILRRAVLLALNFVTINLVLARVLPVSTIGVFNIANSILAFFSFFSDIGLAAALIQKKEIKREDLSTTFTIQEIIAFLISFIVFVLAPQLAIFYKLETESVWLIRALAICFFLTSLKVIPSVLLERELKFGRLVVVEVCESLIFNFSLILFTFKGLSINAFTYASLLRTIAGVIVIFCLSPWAIGFGINKNSAKSLINFGLPFQFNSILALLKDKLVPLVIARMVGSLGIGYITWAQNLSFVPLEVMNIITRITFPAFSRIQDDKEALKGVLEQSIFFLALFFYPLSLGLLAVAPSLVAHVVSNKWLPSLPLVYLFSVTAFMSTLSSPFTNFLNAIGKIKITLRLMVMWTILEWLLTPALTTFFNYYGVAIASSVISLTAIIPIVIIKRMTQVKILPQIWQPLISAALMSIIVYNLAQTFVFNLVSLLVLVVLGGFLYLLFMSLIAWDKISSSLKNILS